MSVDVDDIYLEKCRLFIKGDSRFKHWRVVYKRGAYYFFERVKHFVTGEWNEYPAVRIKRFKEARKSEDLWEFAFMRYTGKWQLLPIEERGRFLRMAGSFEECLNCIANEYSDFFVAD